MTQLADSLKLPAAKASCVSQILTAKAVAEDLGSERAARSCVKSWAKCGLTNSERDFQQTIKRQKSKLDIPVSMATCDGVQIPWISPESWLQFIVDKGLWPVMSGRDRFDHAGARCNWMEFWRQYRKIHPTFQLFDMADNNPEIDLSRTAAFLIHGDEGRTLKRNGLLVTSLQSALGKGYDEKRVAKHGGPPVLQVNFAGHSFTTRHVVSCIPKTCYETQPEVFHSALDHVAKSCSKILLEGYKDQATGETFRVAIIGVKGDAPYLQKVAHFYRSYNTVAKRGEERGPPKGCCPYCLAGTRLCAAEEIASDRPKWLETVAVKLPWVREPSLIHHLPHDPGDPASFFKSDIWHVVHLGFARSWEYLTSEYLGWCRSNHKQAHVSRITAYLMSYGDASGAMGCWHKGALTSNSMLWLVDLLGKIPADPDGLLVQCRAATYRLNSMFALLYKAGVFLDEQECKFVSDQGLEFLKTYSRMALISFRASQQWRFPLYPKLHVFHHLMMDVRQSGLQVKIACNPTLWGCQLDEDTVGRASRLSRRVNIRIVAARSLDRVLVSAYTAYVKAGLLT